MNANAKALNAQMKQIEAKLPYATNAAQKQLVARLAKLRAARNNALLAGR